ncbi:MAG TPA: VOC family protein [Chloroflexota bacterium]|jgi:catechol 2,3-dioxygenase-like lactoylglutathione lyase family enzyme|nr:VOC family protein [Chloroflexota bacterium]
MLVRRIDHTAVFVRDLDVSIAWYEDVLGLTCAYHGDTGNNIPGAFFDVGDTILAMLLTADPSRDLSEQHFAFAVDDADAAYGDLVGRGHAPVSAPEDLPGGYITGQRSFDILDPDGVRIEFVQRANISINPRTLHPAADLAARR